MKNIKWDRPNLTNDINLTKSAVNLRDEKYSPKEAVTKIVTGLGGTAFGIEKVTYCQYIYITLKQEG
jgi:hypothetical protein